MTSSRLSPWRSGRRLGCKIATIYGPLGRGPTPTMYSRRNGCSGMTFASKTPAAPLKPSHVRPPFTLIRDYLGGIRWDGTKRVEQFAEAYLGAAATPYTAQ